MEASLKREFRKIRRNLSGIRTMDKLPGAVFVVDVKREIIAIKEARKLQIPVIALIDTDSDPDEVDIAIPGNDDAMRAIELILKELGDAVIEAKAGRQQAKEEGPAEGQGGGRRERGGRRRPMSAMSADEMASAEKPQAAAPAAAPAPAPAPAPVAAAEAAPANPA